MSGYGINCEKESAHAFEKAGAEAEIIHVNDLIDKLIQFKYSGCYPGVNSYTSNNQILFSSLTKQQLESILNTFIQQCVSSMLTKNNKSIFVEKIELILWRYIYMYFVFCTKSTFPILL